MVLISSFPLNKIREAKVTKSIVKMQTEYFSVAMSEELITLLSSYRKSDPVLTTYDDRKLILYTVNRAITEQTLIATKDLNLSRSENIKLRKTRQIRQYFDSINKQYKPFGVEISSRQYFHRLILGFLEKGLQ